MNNQEYYKTLYEQLQAQCNLIEANIAQAQAQLATDVSDVASYSPNTMAATTAGTANPGGVPIPPGLGPPPGILPDPERFGPMPPIGSPRWNAWYNEWVRLNAPTGPQPGESAQQYQERRKREQAVQRAFQRWRDMYWRLSQQRPIMASAVQESANLIEKRFDISKFNKSKKKDKKSTKDYDGDGEVESSKDEYFGSKDKAIKKAIVDKKKKKTLKEGTVISDGQISYGGFPRILNEEAQEPRRSRGGIVYPSEEYAELATASDAAGEAASAAEEAARKFHQNAAKEWGAIYDNAPAFNRALGNSGRRRAGFADRGQHMAELPNRMLRDPEMRELQGAARLARALAQQAHRARISHPHHAEFMQRAQSQSDTVYGTRGNLGS